MTSPLRKKRPTTARAASTATPTVCSLAVLAGLLLAGAAPAQQPAYSTWSASPVALNAPQPLPASVAGPSGAPPAALSNATPYPLQPARYQAPAAGGRIGDSDEYHGYRPQVEPPGLERLARLDSEISWMERVRQENRGYDPLERVTFPDEPILSTDRYMGRAKVWPDLHLVVAPYYVCYERLLFEQKNFERYGWDLGILTPVVSGSLFFWDVLSLPYHMATAPCRQYECNKGYCLPGDPVPLMLYPPELSLTGLLGEAAAITTVLAVFP